jgi:hypothetical protein
MRDQMHPQPLDVVQWRGVDSNDILRSQLAKQAALIPIHGVLNPGDRCCSVSLARGVPRENFGRCRVAMPAGR